MNNSNYTQVVSLQQMWDTLNPKYIRDIISDRIHFESYWISRPIRGKKSFLVHIKKELQTIKETMKKYYIAVESQVVQTIGKEDEYCLIIKHLVKGMKMESLITVSVTNGKIQKMGIEPIKRIS